MSFNEELFFLRKGSGPEDHERLGRVSNYVANIEGRLLVGNLVFLKRDIRIEFSQTQTKTWIKS